MAYYTHRQLSDLGDRITRKAVDVGTRQYKDALEGYVEDHPPAPQHGVTNPQSGGGVSLPSETEIRAYLKAQYTGLDEIFASFSGPDPADCKRPTEDLYQCAFILQPSLKVEATAGGLKFPYPAGRSWDEPETLGSRISGIDRLMESWQGDAADAFTGYLANLSGAIPLHRDLAMTLAMTLDAHREILSRSYADIWKVGQETLHVLDTVYDCDPQSGPLVFSVASALAAVAAELVTEGAATGLIVAAEGAGLSSAVAGASSPAAARSTITGGTVRDVISSMMTAISKLETAIGDQRWELVRIIRAVSGAVEREAQTIRPAHPTRLTSLDGAGASTVRGSRAFHD